VGRTNGLRRVPYPPTRMSASQGQYVGILLGIRKPTFHNGGLFRKLVMMEKLEGSIETRQGLFNKSGGQK